WKVKYKFLVKRTVSLEKVAHRDPLTGLGNRRAFQRSASILLRQEIPFVLAIIDLDGFKECNDTYGHQRGDEVLREFALLLRSMVRGTDFVFRCGGDEFVVLLQMTTPKEVGEVLKRVEDRLENTSLGIGMSWGTAAFPTESKCLQELFQIADQRLYASKKCRKADSKIKP
ncbi:MAG: GGDEF domain-containing protein, partial [Candidatus Caldatribacteriaceae bacterium]